MPRIRKQSQSLKETAIKIWKVALYIRLSKEDGHGVSYSVENQKQRLLQYLELFVNSFLEIFSSFHRKNMLFSTFFYFPRYILFISSTLFVFSLISKITALKIHSPVAILYLSGSVVSNLFNDTSISIPITEFFGPVIPISVMYAVPFGKILSSAVCTCVCVPNTAVAFPST